jgi:hypothetical protein
MTEKASDILMRTFHVKQVWVERDGVTTRGVRPQWLDWPMHTAAEMAVIPTADEMPKKWGRK